MPLFFESKNYRIEYSSTVNSQYEGIDKIVYFGFTTKAKNGDINEADLEKEILRIDRIIKKVESEGKYHFLKYGFVQRFEIWEGDDIAIMWRIPFTDLETMRAIERKISSTKTGDRLRIVN